MSRHRTHRRDNHDLGPTLGCVHGTLIDTTRIFQQLQTTRKVHAGPSLYSVFQTMFYIEGCTIQMSSDKCAYHNKVPDVLHMGLITL